MFDEFKARLAIALKPAQEKIFGSNNERLEFVMDSFYKLDPTQRNGVLGVLGSLVGGFVFVAVAVYFMRVNALSSELNSTFNALNELRALKQQEAMTSAKFDSLVDKIQVKTRTLNFKPFFEKLARDAKISLKNINDKNVEMDAQNPLSESIREVHVDMRLSKVSIPKLINFIVDIEKSGRFLRVQNLQIVGMYGNKLYFDVNLLVRGYKIIK
ncbi:MAG: hypothetical protein OXT67_13690 [Zetaproteobacteria bacterium]|nr:hypothetical protein [Zetaproteobacteria bacterium]